MSKKPIFMNIDDESGYIGLKCSNPKITCTYLNKSIEVRKYYDKVINFRLDNGFLKTEIMDYHSMTVSHKLKIRYKQESLCLKEIYNLLKNHYHRFLK